ncbi:MAG: hypothetical protein COV66_02510 [Nitrospinae bacterium CG11_big_fil_rev_8_21_14_0_20_45_15]|nr:MAG: hypothetical protein COV66_02510 [Nitrospinae bacterium CG11_big_fil_rev_8_21_14_0_20_45_15]
MTLITNNQRSILLAYNTVERLLKGDFFHFSNIEEIVQEISGFEKNWPVIGLGTTNWYKRNGEAMVEGAVGKPSFLWADPESTPAGKVINLNFDHPDHEENLQSPVIGPNDTQPQFPFMAIAICDPQYVKEYNLSAGENIHLWIENEFPQENLGLAAIHIRGKLTDVQSTAACHIPLGGMDLSDGYSLKDNFKFIEYAKGNWNLQGLYGVNPTIQQVLSVPGHPLHLHGYEVNENRGGHINQAIATSNTQVTVYPIKDINIRIKNMDQAFMPIKLM